jgi:hypothetical protein
MKTIPIYDATAPVACTAASSEIPVRIEQVERLRRHLTGLERTEHGLLLRLPNRPDVDADVRAFTVDEKGCCAFWGFAVTSADGELTLRWDGPPDVNELFDRLFEFFDSDQPLTAFDGLL